MSSRCGAGPPLDRRRPTATDDDRRRPTRNRVTTTATTTATEGYAPVNGVQMY
jgi:hypothetical protein